MKTFRKENLTEDLLAEEEGQKMEKLGDRLERLKVSFEDIRDFAELGKIMGQVTEVALKSLNSHLIVINGTKPPFQTELRLRDDGVEVYSGTLTGNITYLCDIIYLPAPFNCYLLAGWHHLYRKDIDDKPPYFFMDIECSYRRGACFRYSDLNKRLIINKDGLNISLINPKTKKIEVFAKKDIGGRIKDFRLFGEKENRVVAVTEEGYVYLYSFGYENKMGLVGHYQEELSEQRRESTRSIAVCQKNEYVFVEVSQSSNPFLCSRMIILKLSQSQDILAKIASIDQYSQQIGYKYELECLGYVGSHIVWIGLTGGSKRLIQVFDYDLETQQFRELRVRESSVRRRMQASCTVWVGSSTTLGLMVDC